MSSSSPPLPLAAGVSSVAPVAPVAPVAIPRQQQVNIGRLPTKRQGSEPRESMNCKSCRQRKVGSANPPVRSHARLCKCSWTLQPKPVNWANCRVTRSNAIACDLRARHAKPSSAHASTVRVLSVVRFSLKHHFFPERHVPSRLLVVPARHG